MLMGLDQTSALDAVLIAKRNEAMLRNISEEPTKIVRSKNNRSLVNVAGSPNGPAALTHPRRAQTPSEIGP